MEVLQYLEIKSSVLSHFLLLKKKKNEILNKSILKNVNRRQQVVTWVDGTVLYYNFKFESVDESLLKSKKMSNDIQW